MKLMVVFAVLLVLLVLLWFMKLGGRVEYGEEGLRGRIRIGWFYFTVFPPPKLVKRLMDRPQRPKKEKKTPKEEPEEESAEEPTQGRRRLLERVKKTASQAGDYLTGGEGGELGVILRAIPEVFAILGDTVRRLCVEELTVHYTISGRHDAAGAAIQYGVIYTTGGAVCTLMDQFVTVKKRSVGARVDFSSEESRVWLCVDLSYRFGDLVIIVIHVLKEFVMVRNRLMNVRQEEAENEAE